MINKGLKVFFYFFNFYRKTIWKKLKTYRYVFI
jgi:hypothetical protein